MGAVFAARHIKLSKAVAIKIMLADASSPEAAQRFINEGRAAANIQNEHVVRVDDVDEEMGYAYMVLELLDGEDLAQVLEREPTHRLPPHVAVGYVLQALRGVTQAHAIGIVHRDLKPSNLFLAKRKDGTVVVKVLDFGISKAQGSSALAASPSALTSTKAMLGSPLYMSPEQLRSSKSVDHRADIWALGIILYELITGHLPFMGDNLGELFAAILETDPAPLRSRVEGVPPGLEEVVLRCLQRKPEHRFQSAAELAHALAPFANAQVGFSISGVSGVGPMPLGGTAVLGPGAVQTGPAQAVVPPNAALTPNGSIPRPSLPQGGAATGSGPRAIGSTVAMGHVTPQPQAFHQTNSGGWQSTGNNAGLPKSKLPLILGASFGGLALVGILIIGVALMKKKETPEAPVVTASVSPPPTASSLPAAVTTPAPTETAPPPPTATATAATTATTTATVVATSTHTAKPHHTTAPTAKPAETKPPETKPETKPVQTATKPTNNGGNLQNTR